MIEVITAPEEFIGVRTELENAGLEAEEAEVTMRAGTQISLDVEQGQKLLKLLDVLEELDDTQDVYNNADIPEAAYQ